MTARDRQSAHRPRLPRVDPWGPLLAVAGLGVFLLQGFGRRLSPDVALYAYAGQQLADGVAPYVAVLNRAGPLAHLVPGLGALGGRAIGTDELLGMRLLMVALSSAAIWLAYLVGRDCFGNRLAGVVGAATLVAMHGFVINAAGGPREKTTMVLFVLLALWAVARHWWVVAGGSVALATLTWQPAFFSAVVVVVVAAALLPGLAHKFRALVRVAAGGLGVLAVTVLGFWVAGALPEFLEGFLLVHSGGYTTQTGLMVKPARALSNVYTGYDWSTVPLGLGLLSAVGLGVVRLRGGDQRSVTSATTVALGAGTLTGLVWACRAFQGWPDAMVLLPFAAAGLAGLADAVVPRLPGRWRTPTAYAVALSLVLGSVLTSWSDRAMGLEGQRRLAEGMLDAAGPGATIQGIGTLFPIVLTEQRNPSRYVNYAGGLYRYLDDTLPGGLAGERRRLMDRRPTLVVTGDLKGPTFRWLRPTLHREFRLLGGGDGHGYWYVTTAAEPSTVEELRMVLDAAGAPLATGP